VAAGTPNCSNQDNLLPIWVSPLGLGDQVVHSGIPSRFTYCLQQTLFYVTRVLSLGLFDQVGHSLIRLDHV